MHNQWIRNLLRLPISAWLLFAMAVYVPIMGYLAVTSYINTMVGQPYVGVLTRWWGPLQCTAVTETTPPSWPLLASRQIQPGDCIAIIGETFTTTVLQERQSWPIRDRFVNLLIQRGTDQLIIYDQLINNLTATQLWQVQTPMIFMSLLCWLLASIVLVAKPTNEQNRVLAGLFFLLALAIISLNHAVEWPISNLFNILTIYSGIALIGATGIHFALLFPQPLDRFGWLRLIGYPFGIISLVMHVGSSIGEVSQPFSTLVETLSGVTPDYSVWPYVLDGILWFISLPLLLGRLLWVLYRRQSPQLNSQAWVILISWMLGMLPPMLATGIYLISRRWMLPGTTLITFLFFLPIAIAGSAYAMLRYQSFAYRGRVLSILTIMFVSTAITCIIMLVLSLLIGPVDGFQFLMLWLGVMSTTIFWFVGNPVRNIFRRHFLRNQDQYQAVYRFAEQLEGSSSTTQVVMLAAPAIAEAFSAEWVAIWRSDQPTLLFLHQGDQTTQRTGDAVTLLPTEPVFSRDLGTNELIGKLWIGPRTAAEPFDREDAILLDLLTDYLTRMMVGQLQIEKLAAVPGMLLAAEDRERRRLAHDLHDSALGFFGALPLRIERARRLSDQGKHEQLNSLYQSIEQDTRIVAQQVRGIVSKLSPHNLSQGQFVASVRSMAEQQCHSFAITLVWHADEGWNHLSNQQALHTYRIIEQAISNAIQHGAPDTISITLTSSDQHFVAQIQDDGCGFDSTEAPLTGHYGIESMHERARSLRGDLQIESTPGSGTTIRLQLPIDQQHAIMEQNQQTIQQIKPKQPTAQTVLLNIRQRLLLATAFVAILPVLFFQQIPEEPQCTPSQQSSSQRFFVYANNQANKTGICVSPGDTLIITTVAGVWSTDSTKGLVGAEGHPY
ncbi:MAG: hypothetical protein Fur005_35930 [Roseiflexaceae bacterium]